MCIYVCIYCVHVHTHQLHLYIGTFANEAFNYGLKHAVKEPRPSVD